MLLFMDSGDHYSGITSSGKWDFAINDFDPTSFAGQGRLGTNPVLWGWSCRWIGKNLGANYSELITGWAAQYHGDSNFGGHNQPSISYYDGGTSQFRVNYDVTDGVFRIYRGHAGTLVTTISYAFNTGSFQSFGFRVKFHGSTGEWELRAEGNVIGSGTGLNTISTGNAYANRVYVGDEVGGQANDVYYDDIYVLETASGENVDFLGDVRVEPLFPSGNGNSSQFIGSDSDSTDNYLLVDEHSPNGDTDYVQSGSVGDKDTYAYTDMSSASGTVFGVQPLISAKKTDAGTRSIASVARLSTTEEDSADEALSTSYTYMRDIRELDPNGAQWTITSVNAAEFGVKVTV